MMFSRLLSSLPSVGASKDADEQIRAVLSPLVTRMVSGYAAVSPVAEDASTCPNCSVSVASERSPYCSAHCREMAAFIRQFRSSLTDGSIFEAERQMGMGQALWSLQGGGFPRRQQLVPPKVLAKVLERDGGVCQVCGAPATEIDHTGSGWNRPLNLRAVCSRCNRATGFGEPGYDTGEIARLYDECAARICAPSPVRCCDDATTWDWRAYLGRRKALARIEGEVW